jgi:KR domain
LLIDVSHVALQIGGAYLPSSEAQQNAAAMTRVPVGLAAYAPRQAKHLHIIPATSLVMHFTPGQRYIDKPRACAWRCRAFTSGTSSNAQSADRLSHGTSHLPLLHADGSVSTGFGLASPTHGGIFQLSGLHLKPVQLGKQPAVAAAAAARAATDGTAAEMLYTVDWTVVKAASGRQADSTRQLEAAGAWRLTLPGSRNIVVQPACASDAARSAISQLRAVQQAADSTPAAAGSAAAALLCSRGLPEDALQRPTPHVRSAAAARALLRVAAQETQAVTWRAVASDHLDAQRSLSPGQSAAADAFGAVCTNGTWMEPRLSAATSSAGAGLSSGSGMSTSLAGVPAGMAAGTVLVTGGLGEVGFLVATWLAATSGATHVVLLGRSGRAAKLSAALQVSAAAVLAAILH